MINSPCPPSPLEDQISKLDQEGQLFFGNVVSELERLRHGNAPRPSEESGLEINGLRKKLDAEGRAALDVIVLELMVRRSEYF
jgi:hypothetical protein